MFLIVMKSVNVFLMEEFIVLEPNHKEMIMSFERARMNPSHSLEQEMQTWDARWRSEALDHYLRLGWSFAVMNSHNLRSYVLAQPFVFFRGRTQTLWVEWLGATEVDQAHRALEVAYRWAREKHFQNLVMDEDQPFSSWALSSPFSFQSQGGLLISKTSKIKT